MLDVIYRLHDVIEITGKPERKSNMLFTSYDVFQDFTTIKISNNVLQCFCNITKAIINPIKQFFLSSDFHLILSATTVVLIIKTPFICPSCIVNHLKKVLHLNNTSHPQYTPPADVVKVLSQFV